MEESNKPVYNKVERQELSKLSLRDLFFKYVKYLPLYVIFLALSGLGAWLYLRYTMEQFEAAGTILIKNTDKNQSDKVEDLIEGKYKTQGIQNEIEILKSKSLIERVVKRLNLQFEYIGEGKIKDANVYRTAPFVIEPLLLTDSQSVFSIPVEFISQSQFRIDGESKNLNFGQVFENKHGVFKLVKMALPSSGSKFRINYVPSSSRAAQLAKSIFVQPKYPNVNTGIIAINAQTQNPYLAADIVNILMQQYELASIEQNNYTLDLTIGFVDKRLAVVARDIDSLQKQLVAFQRRNDLVSPQTQVEKYLTSAGQQEEMVLNRQLAINNLNQIEQYLGDKKNEDNRLAVPSSLGIEDKTLNSLVQKYNDAQLEKRALIESQVPADNPKILALKENIELLRRSTLENISNLKSSYEQSLSSANLEKSKNKSKALTFPAKVTEQIEIERQLDSKLALFKLLNSKLEETAISRASTISNSTVIQEAEANKAPIKPDRRTVQLAAVLIGLLIPTAIVFLRELLNDKVSTRNDIEKITEAPILGEIGHSYSDKTLIVNLTNRSLIAEQFRILRSNLQYIIGNKPKYTILVTSSFSGEGKSFISTNMGSVLALTGKKVIILEFDIRKPRVLAGLEISKRPGITNYIVGQSNIDDLIVPVEGVNNLFVLPCGPLPPNPSELLLDTKVAELFDALKARFDNIIIDTAPVGMVSDAMTLGRYADCTIYVTRQGHTYKKQIALIDEMYNSKKLPHLTLIINDVKMPTGGGYYGSYGGYGYGYGYGYGEKNKNNYYEDEVKPKKKLSKRIIDSINPKNWFS